MAGVEACRLEDLPHAKPTVTTVGGREIVLVNWHGDVYALRNICPHQSASFGCGTAIAHFTGNVDEIVADAGHPVITCPWHEYEFALASGRCLTDPRLRVRSYSVDVKDGVVFVDPKRSRSRR